MIKQLYFLIGMGWVCCLAFPSCVVDNSKLLGDWQAVAFYENGHDVPTALEPVSLHFGEHNTFEFRSQGFYQEAGSYRLSASYLFLTDTTANPRHERTVKILYLAEDTLKIEMKSAKNKQVLFFKRKS